MEAFFCINECSMRCSLGPHTQREYNSVIEFWLDSTEPFATVSYEDGLAPFHSFLSILLIANLIMVVITIRRTRSRRASANRATEMLVPVSSQWNEMHSCRTDLDD